MQPLAAPLCLSALNFHWLSQEGLGERPVGRRGEWKTELLVTAAAQPGIKARDFHILQPQATLCNLHVRLLVALPQPPPPPTSPTLSPRDRSRSVAHPYPCGYCWLNGNSPPESVVCEVQEPPEKGCTELLHLQVNGHCLPPHFGYPAAVCKPSSIPSDMGERRGGHSERCCPAGPCLWALHSV